MLGRLFSALRSPRSSGGQIEVLSSAIDRLFEACVARPIDPEAFLQLCCETIAKEICVDRVGVWRLDEDAAALLSVNIFDAGKGAHFSGRRLDFSDAPSFARVIREERTFAVRNVALDPGTAPLFESYFRHFGTVAIVQAHILGAKGPLGTLGVSMTGRERDWTREERAFLSSIAGLIGLVWERSERSGVLRELEETRRKAELAHRRLVNAIEALPDGFVLYDEEDRLVLCNEQYRKAYGEVADFIKPGNSFGAIIRAGLERDQYPDARGREEAWFAERMAAHRDPKGPIEQRLNGDRHLRIEERRTPSGDTVGFRVDVTELTRQQRRLQELADALATEKSKAEHEALHDGLTGLPNRRHLDRRLAEISTSKAHADVYALHVDLDRFKQINDTLGHAAGDFVLQSVARTLRAAVRDVDFVARVGGDEFVVLCDGAVDGRIAQAIAERVVSQLAEPVSFEGNLCRFGASVGVASAPAARASDLLVRADLALYEAKALGRNRVEIFSAALHERMTDKKILADELLRGLETDAFVPYFQPQIDAVDGSVAGVEALARWRHPERGDLSPVAFLEVAEELNVVGALDRMIFRKAVAACARFKELGAPIPKLGVNVSMARLKDADLAAEVASVPADAPRIAFELLETIYLDDHFEAEWSIDHLRELGVEFEIDDFGSGRASIIALLKIEPRRLKIDRNLVAPITRSPSYLKLVKSIIGIGRAQGVGVIAEGVETEEHARILAEIGVDALQGYYFAAPLGEEAFVDFLRDRAWPGADRALSSLR